MEGLGGKDKDVIIRILFLSVIKEIFVALIVHAAIHLR
jgi:hypothetical protein